EQGAGAVLPVLQRGAAAPVAGLPDAGGGVPAGTAGGGGKRRSFSPGPPSAPGKGGPGEKERPGSRGRRERPTRSWETDFSHRCSDGSQLFGLDNGVHLTSVVGAYMFFSVVRNRVVSLRALRQRLREETKQEMSKEHSVRLTATGVIDTCD